MSVDTAKLHQILARALTDLQLELTSQQCDMLVEYINLMAKWNKAYNLTSVRDPEQMMTKHVVDSLACAHLITQDHLIDVGTGPGLPGIPLAIAFPTKSFVLLDSLGKRVRFMLQVKHALGLQNITPVQSRVEDYHPAEPFDAVLSRAFASLKDMLHWCQHLVNSEGKFLALKGQLHTNELDEVSNHFHVDSVNPLNVPGLIGERHLVIIDKST